MILIMTFRMPNGAVGPLYAFIVSRENLISTVRSALVISLSFGAGAVLVLVSAMLFATDPFAHFLWVAGSLFVMFFLLRAMSNFTMAAGLVSIGSTALTTWYLPGPAEQNVELTMWAAFLPALGSMVTVAVELVFHAFHREDELLNGLTRRWEAVESLLRSYSDNEPVSSETAQALSQLATVGAGALRRRLRRSDYDPLYQAQMMAVISITARSLDFAAVIEHEKIDLAPQERQRVRELAQHIARIRECLIEKSKPEPWTAPRNMPSSLHLLPDLERMVALIPQVFEGSASLEPYLVPEQEQSSAKKGFFVEDAFQNPVYIRYALGWRLSSTICNVIYVGLA